MAAKQGISQKAADAELAASTRKSSQATVNKNPKLALVSGTKKPTTKHGLAVMTQRGGR